VAALTALATGETDIMKLIVGFGFGVGALAMLILSIWTINALNLYSASLSLTATFPRFRQWTYTVVGGVVGTIIALLGIIDAFIPFLIFLGIIIPPIAAIYVIDGLATFRGMDPAESLVSIPALRWEAIGTWLVSVVVAVLAAYAGLTLTTVPALDATIVAAIVYLIVLKRGRHSRALFADPTNRREETLDA
jgi:cytosine permease